MQVPYKTRARDEEQKNTLSYRAHLMQKGGRKERV